MEKEVLKKKDMQQKVRQFARENFSKGLNCAESVYLALIDAGLVELPPETVALTTAFGGGIGLSGGVCGALVAATMCISAVHGRKNPTDGNQQQRIDKLYGNPGLYRFFNQIPYNFINKYGSTQCKDLNLYYPEWLDKDRLQWCTNIVMESAAMAVEFIYQGNTEGYQQPFGTNMVDRYKELACSTMFSFPQCDKN